MSSKIKVDTIENVAGSGNVSLGSGHNLVVPGNITGQGTTTLTGDLTVDTTTLKVDSSNNRVGIGTASPSQDLTIVNSGSARMELVSGTSGTSIIDMGDSSDKDIGGIRYVQSSDTMQFRAGNDVRMSIDSGGRIFKPNQPAFSISGGPNSYQNGSGTETVILHGQSGAFSGDMNIGGHFSYSNGRFTAPVAGNYMFTYTLTSGDTNAHFVELRVNDGSRTTVLLYSTQYQSGCHSTIYSLAANDFVTAQRRGTGYAVYSAVFSGFLLS